MRILGHPAHVMVIHFPVALWPAHFGLHVFASRLPEGVASVAGFWILCAGTGVGWIAALLGAADLIERARERKPARLKIGLIHAAVNGTVLFGFTAITFAEYARYPAVDHGEAFLAIEGALLAGLGVGNYFGGSLVWTPAASDAA